MIWWIAAYFIIGNVFEFYAYRETRSNDWIPFTATLWPGWILGLIFVLIFEKRKPTPTSYAHFEKYWEDAQVHYKTGKRPLL